MDRRSDLFNNRIWPLTAGNSPPEEELHIDSIDENFQQGRESTMAWGGFCRAMKSELVFIPWKAKMDSALYVETIMKPYLVPF